MPRTLVIPIGIIESVMIVIADAAGRDSLPARSKRQLADVIEKKRASGIDMNKVKLNAFIIVFLKSSFICILTYYDIRGSSTFPKDVTRLTKITFTFVAEA